MFNEEIIFFLKPNISYSLERYSFLKKVIAKDGINTLKILMNGYNDGIGFKIGNVSLHR
jgi:hypothetical protein